MSRRGLESPIEGLAGTCFRCHAGAASGFSADIPQLHHPQRAERICASAREHLATHRLFSMQDDILVAGRRKWVLKR